MSQVVFFNVAMTIAVVAVFIGLGCSVGWAVALAIFGAMVWLTAIICLVATMPRRTGG